MNLNLEDVHSELLDGFAFINRDEQHPEDNNISSIMGAGAVQLGTDGGIYYRQWDRTHALSVEEHLYTCNSDDSRLAALDFMIQVLKYERVLTVLEIQLDKLMPPE